MIVLETDRARVEVDPAFGARVCALWDKRARREWLVTGPREGDASDAALYRAAEARGWDECFPTVGPCSHPAWGGLRDHGVLWGRPWTVVAHGTTARATFEGEGFAFRRMLELHGASLDVVYEVENTEAAPLRWMWSQHALLAARPGEIMALHGFDGFTAGGAPFDWPAHPLGDLSVVGEAAQGFALKAYATAKGHVRAAIEGAESGIVFKWDSSQVPALGLWLDWGGWPEEGPVHQLAIEPTTAACDDLATAEATGVVCALAPGEVASWRMSISFTDAA
jgi:hypothetical protein